MEEDKTLSSPPFRPEEHEEELRRYAVDVAMGVGLSREDAEKLVSEIWGDISTALREAGSLEEAREIVRRMVEPEARARIPPPKPPAIVPPAPPAPPKRPPGAMTKTDIFALQRWFGDELERRVGVRPWPSLFREVEEQLREAYQAGLTRGEAEAMLREKLERAVREVEAKRAAPPPPPPPLKPFLPPPEAEKVCAICGKPIEPTTPWTVVDGKYCHWTCFRRRRGY